MKHRIVLASKSPRRQQLLSDMGIDFTVRTQETDESFPDALEVRNVARFLAEKKAKALTASLREDEVLITADTTVIVDEVILGKPDDAAGAAAMLKQLSGKAHDVITGVCITTPEKSTSFSDTTKVYFRHLKADEIQYYIQNHTPYDKAGSYAIQEWIGMVGIEKIAGSYFNVVGLPTEKLYSILKARKLV